MGGDKMIKTGYPRPCPIPGHPQDGDEPVLVTESAWSRLRAWHLHAPAERLPLPLVLTAWPVAWVLHAVHVPGHFAAYAAAVVVLAARLAWGRHEKAVMAAMIVNAASGAAENSPLPPAHLAAAEAAAVTAAIGGWLAAAVTWGPSGWPFHLLTWIYAAGSAAGYWWLRRHDAIRAARARRDEDAIAETLAHILGLRYGRIELRGTEYPGQLVVSIREQAPTVDGPVTHPALDPDSPYAPWLGGHRSIRDPVPVGVIPETGEPMELVLWDSEGGKAIGVYSMTGGGKTNMLDVIREAVTAMDDAVLVNINGAGSSDERAWEPLSLLTAAGLQADNPELQGKISGARCGGCGT
jgi:hypothetical protein